MKKALVFGIIFFVHTAFAAKHREIAPLFGSSTDLPASSVSLEWVTEAAESPGRGYPLIPFPMPNYPLGMLLSGSAGEVEVRLVIGTDGAVTDATIVRTSGKEFGAPVLAATRFWRFVELPDPKTKLKVGLIETCRFRFSID